MSDLDRVSAFSKTLSDLMTLKGWHQSELARQAGLPRDSISVYLRGKSLPNDKSLRSLANALDVGVDELLPRPSVNLATTGRIAIEIDEEKPDFAMLTIHRKVPLSVARQILDILDAPSKYEPT